MKAELFSRITYGLYVVSTFYGEQRNGYISNTVFQVTADPPRFAIACSKNNQSATLIEQSKVFSVSALKRDTRPELIGTFGFRSGRDIDKFATFTYRTALTGCPILLDDTLAWFECRVIQVVDVGTHLLFIGDVVNGDLVDERSEPLTYKYYQEVKKGKAPKNAPTYIDPEKFNTKSTI